MTRRLLLGTRNAGKVAELRALLAGLDLDLQSVNDLADPPPDPPEDAPTYAENAVSKAVAYARATGLPTIADDSGLEVEALGGAPGLVEVGGRYRSTAMSEAVTTAIKALNGGLFVVGFAFESVGDWQLARFKASAGPGQIMDRGLWRYTRHPNYFGDFMVWWGIYLIALSTGGAWWSIVAPLVK